LPFQPTSYTLGHLWQCNEISVAQEHLATAIIEGQMGELHPIIQHDTCHILDHVKARCHWPTFQLPLSLFA
jgi:hypothetical protein